MSRSNLEKKINNESAEVNPNYRGRKYALDLQSKTICQHTDTESGKIRFTWCSDGFKRKKIA